MIRKQGISLLLIVSVVFSLCGCGQKVQETNNTKIELLEPVNVASNTEQATYRNIYNYKVYPATVYPTITEYSFADAVEVESDGAFWGEEVEKGSTLAYASTEAIDEQIEKLEERIAEMEESMAEAEKTLNEDLAEPREEEKRLASIVENFEKEKPKEKVYASELENSVSGGDAEGSNPGELVDNPKYLQWKAESDVWLGKYRMQAHNIDMQEEALRQSKELYDLEHAYLLKQLQDMKSNRNKNVLSSTINGEVVARVEIGYENYKAGEEEPIIAVGDVNEKVLKTDYINKGDISNADDVYALIDGVRYEVEYQPLDNDEYAKISATGSKVYSTFVLQGDLSQVNVGDYAVLTVFSDKKEQVLSVPKEALHKDESGSFVYVMQGEESVSVPVRTGISDGAYTEIISGLSEGDAVLVENTISYSEQTAKVEYGSINSSFENRGIMYYSESQAVLNPVEYGTTYFGEYQVAQYQHVEKGDVIATVRVMKDDLAIQRNKVKLQRAQERLADLQKEDTEKNAKSIEAKQEEIAEINELIADMESDGAVTKIRADRSGIIVGLGEYEAETIIFKDSYVAEIADENACYVVVENTNQALNYGNEVTISYTNNAGQPATSSGVVANVGPAGVSKNLQSELSFILLPKESIGDMSLYNNDPNAWWNWYRYDVAATVREMDNVLVVPKRAVTEINGCTYVNVMDEQGNVKTCSFVAGGYDNTNYWIIEGLSEGMVLCLK